MTVTENIFGWSSYCKEEVLHSSLSESFVWHPGMLLVYIYIYSGTLVPHSQHKENTTCQINLLKPGTVKDYQF